MPFNILQFKRMHCSRRVASSSITFYTAFWIMVLQFQYRSSRVHTHI